MAHIPDWWKANQHKSKNLVPVYIVNLDIAQSSRLEGQHPFTFKRTVNRLQQLIENELQDADFFFESWSGDGLVALHDGRRGESIECLEK